MSKNKWMEKLAKGSGAMNYEKWKPSTLVARTSSPGINYLFGKTQGMQAGYSALIYGPPKSGKSLVAMAFAGQLHKDDPEAIIVHFDTEFRRTVPTWAGAFGIDMNRIQSYTTNNPEEIFDFLVTDVKAMLQEGAPIRMIIIDSLAMIDYPKEANAEKTTNAVMGDAASYLPRAMKKLLPMIREYNMFNIMCQHVRDQMDPMKAKYYPWVVPGGKALKHSVEYWLACQKIESKDSKVFDSEKKDGSGNPIQIGHAIRVKMEENSLGPQNRSIETHLLYTSGLSDQHLEIAEIAKNMGVVDRPNNVTYKFGDKTWTGFNNFANAIKADTELQQQLLMKISENDLT